MNPKYDDIAPLYDHEVEKTIKELIEDPGFFHAVKYVFPGLEWEEFANQISKLKTKFDFQTKIISPFIGAVVRRTSKSVNSSGWDNINKQDKYLYLSNHRDIILDAGLLNITLDEHGYDTTEIAIGDNLLVYPWIEKLVRLNKSFIVKRGVSVRQMLEVSKHLSEYIHYAITKKKQSVWLAQREGRAKDSNDRTQLSLLKMLTLAPEGVSFIDSLKELNIIPLSISYEYDPCDYLKAQEFQMKRDDPEYKKSQRDDLINMETGLLNYKGHIHFQFGKQINEDLDKLKDTDKKLQIEAAANCIDRQIHLNYRFYPCNYVAYDLLNKTQRFRKEYTDDDIADFKEYLNKQIEKIDIPNKDCDFLQEKMLVMYSNTLKNHLEAKENYDYIVK
ncbi:MAG: 1-acyl-sn-glycerol-3-phosphate acyltransferase [Dysgonomonas sp.]